MSQHQQPHDDFARAEVERITERAGRRIRDLVVSCRDGQMTVRGSTNSYYVWQLAIAACRESLVDTPNVHFDCVLQVDKRQTVRTSCVQKPK